MRRGTSQQPGIIFLTMQELFEKIAETNEEKVTEVTLSYLEIYNETIRDLLVEGGSKQTLMLREDANQAVSVAGLSSHRPQNVSDVPTAHQEQANGFEGPRSHGYHCARQRIPNNVPHRGKRNFFPIARCSPNQRIIQG
jgi:hypothetical protein